MRIILFILLFHNLGFCQWHKNMINDSIVFNQTIHKRLYEFKIPETPFSVTLIEYFNGNFKGTINISVYRRYKNVIEDFESRLKIGDKKVKRLFNELDQNQFELLSQPEIQENCKMYLDGDFTFFTITTPVICKTIYFYGIYLDAIEEDCESNLKAQKILNLLSKEIDFKSQLENFKNVLPSGNYSYITGALLNQFIVE